MTHRRRVGPLVVALAALVAVAWCAPGDLTNPDNVYDRGDGRRRCRPCTLRSQKEWRARRARADR